MKISNDEIARKKLQLNSDNCKSLRETVFETIRNAIVNGDLKPGERLMEIQLAEELGVSRTPIRESIRKLELEGFVRMIPRKGAFVSPMSLTDLKEMMQIRRALESLAAELASHNATKSDVESMKESNRYFEESAKIGDEEGIISYDIAFHDCIYNATQNKHLITMINSLREQTQRIRVEYVQNIKDKLPLIGQHQNIIKHIESRDDSQAAKYAEIHIAQTEKDMVAVFERTAIK